MDETRFPDSWEWDDPDESSEVDDLELEAITLSAVLRSHAVNRRWDCLFTLARSREFLDTLDRAARQPASNVATTTPVQAIDMALSRAVELGQIADITYLVLARADWGGRPRSVSPLEMLHSGDPEVTVRQAQALADRAAPEQSPLWQLLLAWDLHDQGELADAVAVLQGMLRAKAEAEAEAEAAELADPVARRLAGLMHLAFLIDKDLARELTRRCFQDQGRVALCQKLADRGRCGDAVTVAQLIQSPADRISELAALVGGADRQHVDSLWEALVTASSSLGEGKANLGNKDTALVLARVALAAARSRGGATATELFTAAVDAAVPIEDSDDRDDVLQVIACAQLLSGLYDQAEKTAERMTYADIPSKCHDRWETLEAIAVAYVRNGRPSDAARVMRGIRPAYADYARAVNRVAPALISGGYREALMEMAIQAYAWDQPEILDRITRLPAEHVDYRRPEPSASGSPSLWLPSGTRMVLDNFASVRRSSPTDMSEETFARLLAEDDEYRALLLMESFHTDSHLGLDSVAGPDSPPWRTLRLPGSDGATRVYRAFLAAGDAPQVAEVVPTHGSEQLWQQAEAFEREGRASEARQLFAEALQRDEYEHFDSEGTGRRSRYEVDFSLLRAVALSEIATSQVRAGDEASASRSVELADAAAARMTDSDQAYADLAIARAELELTRINAAFSRCARHLSSNPLAPRIALECVQRELTTSGPQRSRALGKRLRKILKAARHNQDEELGVAVAALVASSEERNAVRKLAGERNRGHFDGMMLARAAEALARRGDLGGAEKLAGVITNYPARAEALWRVAQRAAGHGQAGEAARLFEQAVEAADESVPGNRASLLIDIAAAQCATAFDEAAFDSLATARCLLGDCQPSEHAAKALTKVGELYAILGDRQEALAVTNGIDHPWFKGRAHFLILTHWGARHSDQDALGAIANTIENPWWRVAGLAAWAIAGRSAYPNSTPWREVNTIIATIPRGDSRTRLLELLVKAALASGEADLALTYAQRIPKALDLRLLSVGRILATEASSADLMKLLQLYTETAASSLFACSLLARSFPDQAHVVASEVATYTPTSTHAIRDHLTDSKALRAFTDHAPADATGRGITMAREYERTRNIQHLETAITLLRDAVAATATNDPARPERLSYLGAALGTRFERTGQEKDLDEAIALLRDAINKSSPDRPDRTKYLCNLGNALTIRFQCTRQLGNLDEAITLLRDAVTITAAEHPNRPIYLFNLGNALRFRFEHAGQLADLDEAITVGRDAVTAIPLDRPEYVTNLGNALLARFEHTGQSAYLDEAITLMRCAVAATPGDHPDRPAMLSKLGNALRAKDP